MKAHLNVDDEVLCIIAEGLATFVPLIGGLQYAKLLLDPLKTLCLVEETAVTEKVFSLFFQFTSYVDSTFLNSLGCILNHFNNKC